MERRFESRLQEMLAQAQVPPGLTKGLLARLETFVPPFTASLGRAGAAAAHRRVPDRPSRSARSAVRLLRGHRR